MFAVKEAVTRSESMVNDTGIGEGELVYTHNHAIKGRNKIQDWWDATLYKVVRQPREGGAPYSIIPVGQEGPIRQVHRAELRVVPKGMVVMKGRLAAN